MNAGGPPGVLACWTAREHRRVLAHLVASLGLQHLAVAEDALQIALLRALQRWPLDGEPAHPAGWLYVVARRAALDQLRAQAPLQPWPENEQGEPLEPVREASLAATVATPADAGRFDGELHDEELALLFAACHPALPQATQVALALRTMAAFQLPELASALLSTPAAVAQRLSRARAQLAGLSLDVPAGPELPPRRDSVLTVLSLMFLCGQRGSGPATSPSTAAAPAPAVTAEPADAARPACWEAIRLARALAAHAATAHPDADALAAMLLLHGARLTGRLDEAGDIVPLPGQPRDRWDRGMIAMGLRHLQASQRAQQLSRWHLQAGIAAELAAAPCYEATDWKAIARYYALLVQADPSAAPRLAQAIAQVESGEAASGLERLQALLPGVPDALRAHTLAAMARALEQLQRLPEARARLQDALAAAPREADRRLLQRRLDSLR
ncbi:MAG: hypothetical protein JNJ71_17535 [Rubrivivax sp.]|nr:hypothetical protein [Rubrivivax sp.]